MESVSVVAENVFAFVAASGDVIASAGPFDAQGACDERINQRAFQLSTTFVQMKRHDPKAPRLFCAALHCSIPCCQTQTRRQALRLKPIPFAKFPLT